MIDVYFPVVRLVETGVEVEVEVGRSRVRFPMVSLEFFIDEIIPTALWLWGSIQPLIEMSTRNISWG